MSEYVPDYTNFDPSSMEDDQTWMGDTLGMDAQASVVSLNADDLMWLNMDLSSKPGVTGDLQFRGLGSDPSDPTAGNSGRATSFDPRSGNQDIDGILFGYQWTTARDLTYSFPTTNQTYGTAQGGGAGQYPDAEPFTGFGTVTLQQQTDIKRALGLIFQYAVQPIFDQITDATTQGGTPHATLRFANSGVPPTANARFPTNNGALNGNYAPEPDIKSGDIFYGGTGGHPVPGNFDSGNALIHEIGHALGLKHGHDPSVYGPLPANHDDNEYSVMTYRAYIGGGTGASPLGPGSSPQTYMMDDIAAFQYMYGGAYYGNLNALQTYTWSPTTGEEFINGASQWVPFNNHIFSTVWTEGSNSTYDLSNYNTNGLLDMRPGMGFLFSTVQQANLGYYDNPIGNTNHLAQYNVYNSLDYQGNTSSEIQALITGNGNNTVYGNNVFNTITLGSGNDLVFAGNGGSYITGNGGNNEIIGGAGGGSTGGGNSIFAFGGNNFLQGGVGSPSDVLEATGPGNDTLYGGSGNNYIVGGTGTNTIVGGGGALETLYGNGASGNDYIVGGYSATASNVLAETGTGAASLWGGPGNNYEVGGPGNDLVVGGGGTNYLFGGSGNDTIYGGPGTNYIYPGFGNDFIWTNPIGTQTTGYIYEGPAGGVDTVADFLPGNGSGHDVLVLNTTFSNITSFADVQAKAFQAGIYTVLPITATDQVYLYNVQPSQLTGNDFIFTP